MNKKNRNPIIRYNEKDSMSDKILSIRGIPKELRRDFINPPRHYIDNPFLLENMERAVHKTIFAIQNDLHICVYGDPDADGITSTAVLYNYLKLYTDNISFMLNQREESHGVIPSKVSKDVDLLIIVDSSTNSAEECSALDCEIIILDHHDKEVENPSALIVNPKTCDYKNKALSGSTVCYQFCRAFDITNEVDFADDFVDLATVGCVGDMMNLSIMENRAIVQLGLDKVHSGTGNMGLYLLFKALKKEFKPSAQDIGYYIAPCLNAVIRLDDINKLMNLFLCNNEKECKKIIKEIIKINEDRKKMTDKIYENLKAQGLVNDDKIIIIDVSNFKQKSGMMGLIANKISREYQRPCFLVKESDGEFRGSGRGYGGEIELKNALNESGLFTLAQGHQNSFGVGFKVDDKEKILSYFNKEFENYYNETFCEYDMGIDYEDMTERLLREIDSISIICGEGFPRPSFLVQGLRLSGCKKIGKDANHTKLTINDDINLDMMKFNTKEDLDCYTDADYINVIGNIGINSFYNFGLKKVVVTRQILIEAVECEIIDI